MAGRVDNNTRDMVMTAFRERVCDKVEVVPFVHQRKWWAAADGLELNDGVEAVEGQAGQLVRLPDDSVRSWVVTPRPDGRARFLSDLGSFKIGKSFGAALWATGFAPIPGAKVSLVGLEYDICEPEFSYLIEFLLSERGMNMKASSVQNRPRDGKMWLDLENGARYEARSWERKDSLKGKEIDAYIYCEAYQLPGIECFTSFSQNLRVRRGYALFPTTPDRPWVKQLHELGHGADPEWHCTCDIPANVNPYSYDARAEARDEKLMTREKFAIHYQGKLGHFVGSVYDYQLGSNTFNARTHPQLFPGGDVSIDGLRVPPDWEIVCGADTGTYMSGAIIAIEPGDDGGAFVLEEFPNYTYVGGSVELIGETVSEWVRRFADRIKHFTNRDRHVAWVDANTTFKTEIGHGLTLLGNKIHLEVRTEVTREYFKQGRIWLAPWLRVLPHELEKAEWPPESTITGKFVRIKRDDHTLDCVEHVLSKRPRNRWIRGKQDKQLWVERYTGKRLMERKQSNPHLGRA